MDLSVKESYEVGPVTFSPNKQASERWLEIGKGEIDVGLACIDIDADNSSTASNKASELLYDYFLLLSWGHGRFIRFNPFDCYVVEDGKEQFESQVFLSERQGEPEGTGPLYGFGPDVREFLNVTYPLLTDPAFNSKTRIRDALIFQLESEVLSRSVAESEFVLSWTAMEILSSAHAKENGYYILLDDTEFRELQKTFNELLLERGVEPEEKRSRLNSHFQQMKIEPVKQRALRFLDSLGFGTYQEEVGKFIRLRNDIVHGSPLAKYSGELRAESVLRLQRLVDKAILKVLGIYEMRYIHSAYLNSDLRAAF